MLVVHDVDTLKHEPAVEIHRGQSLPPFECPERVHSILREFETHQFGNFIPPETYELDVLHRVHSPDYVHFIKTVYDEWRELNVDGEMVPHVWPSRRMNAEIPESLFGRLGYYSFDAGSTISAGTWATVWASARCAMTAARECWKTKRPTFALCLSLIHI